ncbi:MAG: hypothetical protein R3E12_08790 [Candidatus Eisenbacteria bacterium]
MISPQATIGSNILLESNLEVLIGSGLPWHPGAWWFLVSSLADHGVPAPSVAG